MEGEVLEGLVAGSSYTQGKVPDHNNSLFTSAHPWQPDNEQPLWMIWPPVLGQALQERLQDSSMDMLSHVSNLCLLHGYVTWQGTSLCTAEGAIHIPSKQQILIVKHTLLHGNAQAVYQACFHAEVHAEIFSSGNNLHYSGCGCKSCPLKIVAFVTI